MPNGVPGMLGVDHVGITVPDLDAAEHFLVEVLGAHRVYTLGSKQADDDWMQETLGVHPRTVIREIRFYRLATGANIETFLYEAADGQAGRPPRNSDIGGHHLALYVEDIDTAVAYLKAKDVTVMGEATASAGAAEGQRWIYFMSPWGLQFELVSYPQGKAYEQDGRVRLWHPGRPAE